MRNEGTATPIWDYMCRYQQDAEAVRMHMPGHKGHPYVGPEPWDITEIAGADSLYCPDGIIRQSEQNATALFGAQHTYFSCGGCSQSIMAALWLLSQYALERGVPPVVLAARNVHQSFVSGLAQTGMEVRWLTTGEDTLSCPVDPAMLACALHNMPIPPVAVYVTSPDYLGHLQPVEALAEVCHRYGVLLVVDNAHGAYLHFLPTPIHPLDLGADVVCDSAHKTLGVLTGGAYLHLGRDCPRSFACHAKDAMLLVGSTSPSYLILASLDLANATLHRPDYLARLADMTLRVRQMAETLAMHNWTCIHQDPLRLTLCPRPHGQTGTQVAEILGLAHIAVEHADDAHVVLMLSADTPPQHVERTLAAILAIPAACALDTPTPPAMPTAAMSVRQAYLSRRVSLPIEACAGRVLAYLRVSCPPAVPLVMAGEVLTPPVLAALADAGYRTLEVVAD